AERLQQEKAGLIQLRLRFNAESELSRRSLQVDWQQLRQQQAELLEHASALDQRDAALHAEEQQLAAEKRRWEQVRLQFQQEADGLENRIANSRRKLLDQDQELKRL